MRRASMPMRSRVDPDFYRFVRTLEAYDKIIDKNTTIVLPADSPLMKGLDRRGPRPGARGEGRARGNPRESASSLGALGRRWRLVARLRCDRVLHRAGNERRRDPVFGAIVVPQSRPACTGGGRGRSGRVDRVEVTRTFIMPVGYFLLNEPRSAPEQASVESAGSLVTPTSCSSARGSNYRIADPRQVSLRQRGAAERFCATSPARRSPRRRARCRSTTS